MTFFQPADGIDQGEALGSLNRAGLVRGWKLKPDSPPLFIEPASTELEEPAAFVAWVKASRPALDALLVEHGAIVFRGFPVTDTAGFNGFVDQFEAFSGNYQGGASPRAKILGKVYEATQLAGPIKIPLHQEMAYLARGPAKIAFFCCAPADEGGETTIADMRRITRNLPLHVRQRIQANGIMGVRNFEPPRDGAMELAEEHPDQRSWKFAFYTDSRHEVEAECQAKEMEPIWRADGGLTVRNRMPAFAHHPVSGERVYRNTLHTNAGRDLGESLTGERRRRVEEMFARQTLKSGYYVGDGSELSSEEMKALQAVFDEAELAWPWRAGDIMLLDNLLTAHGRNPYKGSGRDVQVALLD